VTASGKIKEQIAKKSFLFLPPLIKNRRGQFNLPVFSPPAKLTIGLLHEQLGRIIEGLKKQQEAKLPEARLEPKISIEEKISLIKKLLLDKIRVNFSKFLATAKSKTEVIVSFLAVLELAKQKELYFDQAELFSEIHISRLPHQN
jgi:segregation and condensation protein A